MKLLYVHWGPTDADVQMNHRIAAAAPDCLDIKCIVGSMPPPKTKIAWPELDDAWKRRDPTLMKFYEGIAEAAADCDVTMLWNGWNLHPEFVASLPTFNIYCCVDDPESSDKQSKPLAPHFDAAMYGNIASGPQYESWGCKRTMHLPIFVDPALVPEPGDETILQGVRDNDIVLCCGQNKWRRERLTRLAAAFPQARCFGHRWNSGWISDEELRQLYRQTKIGWNVHNSTGPINQRLFMLAAWGLMPLCDNRFGLGLMFDLGKEAVGFDTIDEAIEATHYYLKHDDERAAIAEAGYRRFWKDYTSTAVWQKLHDQVVAWQAESNGQKQPKVVDLSRSAATLNPLVSKIRQKIDKRSRRLSTAIERVRFDVSSNDLVETMYLREPVAYRVGKRASNAKAVGEGQQQFSVDDANCNLALAWALTSLIGSAKAIAAVGPVADAFCDSANLEPARGAAVALTVEQSLASLPEMCVMQIEQDALAAAIESLQRPSRDDQPARVVFVINRIAGNDDCDTIHRQLAAVWSTVQFAFLPDPFVPWLEPLDGRAAVSPLIAICDR